MDDLKSMGMGMSWAEQVEQEDEVPPTSEVAEEDDGDVDEKNGIKKIIEIKWNEEEGKEVKVIKSYRVETKRLTKSIARRKQWKKFGSAENDPPGPNPANTIISEEIPIVFINNKEAQVETDEDPLQKLKNQKLVSCRICKGDHWTTRCPYKDTLQPLQENLKEGEKKPETAAGSTGTGSAVSKTGKYVPPSLRDGAAKGRGESMNNSKRDEFATIRVTNLSEDTRESDLQELFRPFGTIHRIYLAKDKNTGQSKGFAFINFHRREDAARAIAGVSGYGYDHLILNVEWAKPSGTS